VTPESCVKCHFGRSGSRADIVALLIVPTLDWDIKLDSDTKMMDVARRYLASDTTSDVKTWDGRRKSWIRPLYFQGKRHS
jgi:hypothetical protein